MSIALVTGSLAPYASRLYANFARRSGVPLEIFQCARVEPGRLWKLPEANDFKLTSLPGVRIHRSDVSHVYINPSILLELGRLKPEFVILSGFSPTMLLAAAYAMLARVPFALQIEGDRDIDPGETSWIHAVVRRWLAKRAALGICTSEAARDMKQSWGLARENTVLVPHVGTWEAPAILPSFDQRPFDLLLCGTLNDRKNPLFLADVVDRLVRDGLKPKVRVVGVGPLRVALMARFGVAGVEAQFDGYLQQADIIDAYSSAKLLVFPTKADTWGLVANEAILCGTPVLASPHAVSARELVGAFGCGVVRELDAERWASDISGVLSSRQTWESFRDRRHEAMAWFAMDKALAGLNEVLAIARAGRPRDDKTSDDKTSGDKRSSSLLRTAGP